MPLLHVVLFSLLSLSTQLFAMDLNQTTQLFNDASKATQALQEAVAQELQENNETILSNNIQIEAEDNGSTIATTQIEDVQETNQTTVIEEVVTPMVEANTSEIQASNITQTSIALTEENRTTEKNRTADENQSLEENTSMKTLNLIELNPTQTTTNIEINLSTESNSSEARVQEQIDSNETQETVQGKMIQGLIIFKTRVKPFCDMTGEEFAKQYAQEDWDDIYYDKQFKEEVLRACPGIEKRYKDSWTPHLYEFALEYASDSEAIPEC